MLTTNFLIGSWKPSGRESHPHHQFLKETGNFRGHKTIPTRVVNVSPSRA